MEEKKKEMIAKCACDLDRKEEAATICSHKRLIKTDTCGRRQAPTTSTETHHRNGRKSQTA